MTEPGKTGLIYTKYNGSYNGSYLVFCMCYAISASFIKFLMDFCIYVTRSEKSRLPRTQHAYY